MVRQIYHQRGVVGPGEVNHGVVWLLDSSPIILYPVLIETNRMRSYLLAFGNPLVLQHSAQIQCNCFLMGSWALEHQHNHTTQARFVGTHVHKSSQKAGMVAEFGGPVVNNNEQSTEAEKAPASFF